jgi:hypothetical protein
MALSTIDPRSSLQAIHEEAVYSQSRLKAHSMAASLAAGFATFLTDWNAVNTQELALLDAVIAAQAKIDECDDDLDSFVDAVSNAILLENNNDRDAPMYVQYFGAKRPFEIKRPILGEELELVRSWIPSLKASSSAMLSKLGAEGQQKIDAADAVVAEKTAADQALRVFRITGERRQLIDKLNALRKSTYGKLAKLPHEPKGRHLPGDFADRFFLHDTTKGKATIGKVRKQITTLEQELSDLREQLAELEVQAAAKTKRKAEAESDQAALAEAERAAAEATAKATELRAKIKKGRKKL